MIKKSISLLSSLFMLLLTFASFPVKAQCDSVASFCEKNFTKEYLSDGQEYRALLIKEQTAEFHITLYGGTTYRFGACSGLEDGNIIFRVYDQDHNELFSNKDHKLSSYWDFKVNSTLNVIVEANINEEKISSGCAVLLVGFKP